MRRQASSTRIKSEGDQIGGAVITVSRAADGAPYMMTPSASGNLGCCRTGKIGGMRWLCKFAEQLHEEAAKILCTHDVSLAFDCSVVDVDV
jgi:hypothetical protein